MAAKVGGYMGKFLAVVFTSIVAPVVVDLAVRDIHGEADKTDNSVRTTSFQGETPYLPTPAIPTLPPATTGWQTPQSPPQTNATMPSAPRTGEVACVVARGVGRTAEEALQDAFRVALRRAIATQVDADTWAREGQALFESVWRNSSGLLLNWKELGAKKEWHLRGTVHREEVAVNLNYRALTERVRSAQTFNGMLRGK